MIVAGSPVVAFVESRLASRFGTEATALGIERGGKVVAGVVFNCWTGPDVQVSVAAEPGAMTRRFLKRVASYVTDELGCIRATIETEQPHVVALALRIGGAIEGVKRDLYGEGRDGTVIGILKKDYRF